MINTRGRIRKENGPFDYSLIENPEYRDLREERSHASSVNDGNTSDIPSKKGYHRFDKNFEEPQSISKNSRNANRRVQAPNRPRSSRGRNDKLVSAQEFEEVVNGFVGFLEELQKVKKKNKMKKPKRMDAVERVEKNIIETAPSRRRGGRNEVEVESPGQNEENEGPTAEQLRYDKNGLYRFKDDVANSRDFLDILKKEEREMAAAQPQQPGQQTRPSRYPEISANEDFLRSNAQLQQLLMQPGILQRLNWNQAGGQGANQDADTLRQLFEMLLSNRPAPTYMNMPPIRESNIMPREAQAAYLGQNRHQMEVARPTTRMAQNAGDGQTPFQTPFRRACTHVALAYFIYMKSLDNDNARPDRIIDPTLNARRLKEQKNLAVEADYHHGNFAIDPRAFADHMQFERQQINNEERKRQKSMEPEHEKSQGQANQPPANESMQEEEQALKSEGQDKNKGNDGTKQENKAQDSQMDIEQPEHEENKDEPKAEDGPVHEQKSPKSAAAHEEKRKADIEKKEEVAEVNEIEDEKVKEEVASTQPGQQKPTDEKIETKDEKMDEEVEGGCAEKPDESNKMIPEGPKPKEITNNGDSAGPLNGAEAKKDENALTEENKVSEANPIQDEKDESGAVEEEDNPGHQEMETESKPLEGEEESKKPQQKPKRTDPNQLVIGHDSLRNRPRRTGYNRFDTDLSQTLKSTRQSSYQLEDENSPLKFKIVHNTKPKNESDPQENAHDQLEPETSNQDSAAGKSDQQDKRELRNPRRAVAKK